MASDQVKERIEVSKAESARLGQRLRGLSAEYLNRPSACDQWAVGDVVAHLVFVVQFQKNMIVRGMQGNDSAPEGARRPGAADVPTEVRIAQGAIRLREKLGEGLLDAFDEKYREGFELMDSLVPDDYAKPCWHPWGPMNVADFVDLVVNELAIHAWDALSPWTPTTTCRRSRCPRRWLSEARRWRAWQRRDRPRFRFDVSDGHEMPDLVVGGDAAPETPSATLSCDGEALVLISCGRLGLEDAMSSGRLSVSGDEGLARELGRGLDGACRGPTQTAAVLIQGWKCQRSLCHERPKDIAAILQLLLSRRPLHLSGVR